MSKTNSLLLLAFALLGGYLLSLSPVAAVPVGKREGSVRCRGSLGAAKSKFLTREAVATFVLFETTPKYRALWSEVRTLELSANGHFDLRLGVAGGQHELWTLLSARTDLQLMVETEMLDHPLTVRISPKTVRTSTLGETIVTIGQEKPSS
jgi:hypothetical protein